MRVILIGFLVLYASFSTQAFQNESEDKFTRYLNKAKTPLDSSVFYLKKADSVASTPTEKIKLNGAWANYFRKTNKSDSMLFWARKNINFTDEQDNKDIQLERAKSYGMLDLYFSGRRNHSDALEALFNASKLFEKWDLQGSNLSNMYVGIGGKYWLLKNFNEAERWWRYALKHAIANDHSAVESQANYGLGLVYVKQHKLSLAKEHYEYAFNTLNDNSRNTWRSKILILNAIGGIFLETQKLDSATAAFEKASEVLEEHHSQGQLYTYYKTLILKNLAQISRRSNSYKEALSQSKEVIQIIRTEYGKDDENLTRNLTELGEIYLDMGNPKEAIIHLLEALRISKLNDLEVARSYIRLGNGYQKASLLEVANSYYDSALFFHQTPIADSLGLYNYTISNALSALSGKVHISLESGEKVDINEISKLYDDFLKIIKYIYTRTDKVSSFIVIQSTMEKFYRTFSQQYKETNDDLWLQKLWEITEITKAVKLRIQLKTEYSQDYTIPQAIINRSKELQDSINTAVSKIEPGSFDSTLFTLKRKYDQHILQLEKDYPRYFALKNKMEIAEINSVIDKLEQDNLLLNFFEGETTIFLMKISSKGLELHDIPKEEFTSWIKQMNQSIFKSSHDGLSEAPEKIKKQLALTEQDLDDFSKLTIIPDGIVWNLNFSALPSGEENVKSYLGNTKNIVLQYYAEQDAQKTPPKTNSVLAFSFNQKSDATLVSEKVAFRDLNTSLPGTSKEVLSISELMDGDYYYASEANETTFKSASSSHSILHLAVHGFQNDYNPENSYLKFTEADSINDGKLHAYEIYNLDLNADLAVLSACHSGNGKIVAGEGMMSIGRAFSYAGVRSLLISRWEVSDYSAPHLMKYFYQGLKKGMYKSEALKYAQTQYLENHADALTSSPFFWSSFYILGDDSPIQQEAGFNPWIMGLLVISGLFGAFIFARKRRQSKTAA